MSDTETLLEDSLARAIDLRSMPLFQFRRRGRRSKESSSFESGRRACGSRYAEPIQLRSIRGEYARCVALGSERQVQVGRPIPTSTVLLSAVRTKTLVIAVHSVYAGTQFKDVCFSEFAAYEGRAEPYRGPPTDFE